MRYAVFLPVSHAFTPLPRFPLPLLGSGNTIFRFMNYMNEMALVCTASLWKHRVLVFKCSRSLSFKIYCTLQITTVVYLVAIVSFSNYFNTFKFNIWTLFTWFVGEIKVWENNDVTSWRKICVALLECVYNQIKRLNSFLKERYCFGNNYDFNYGSRVDIYINL